MQTLPPRLATYDRLLGASSDEREVWTEFAERMRFRIGASRAERRVPFAVGTDLTRWASAAVSDFAEHVRTRVEGGLSLTHVETRERHFGLRAFREGSPERRVARIVTGNDPLLDAGLVESWLVRGGSGGGLLAALRAVYRKSIEEEVRLGGAEPLAWATHLALVLHLRERKEPLKSVTIKGVPYETLERSAGILLAATLAVALEDALSALRGKPGATMAWLSLAISPMSLVAIRQSMLKAVPNPYALTRELADAIDALGIDPIAHGIAARVPQVAKAIGKSRAVALATDVAAMDELRAAVLAYLRDYDVGKEPRHEALIGAVLGAPGLGACVESRAFAAAVGAAESLAAEADGPRRDRLEMVLGHLDAAAKRGSLVPEATLLQNVAESWLAWRCDRWAEERLDLARAHLVDRAKEFAVAELKAGYEAGRIYRLAPDEQPVLLGRTVREDGHLFVDLKGFTKMVAETKELSTAEFLKHQFYVPILEKALGYREAGRRLELNNLLGDAVSFSGDIVAMVFLAEDIRDLFEKYEKERGGKRIEAGLYIAYGAQAETITIDSHGWGDAGVTEWIGKAARVKVAISERINESARGTARNGTVLARMLNLLEERKAREGRELELPWNVFVDRWLGMSLSADVSGLCELALAKGNAAIAETAGAKAAELLKRSLLESVQKGKESGALSRQTDLYNTGRALSREALDAFVRESANIRVAKEIEIPVAQLPREAFARFVFPEETLRLVVSWEFGKAPRPPIVFRHAGEIAFRGFEGLKTTEIWEIVDRALPVYAALERHVVGPRPD